MLQLIIRRLPWQPLLSHSRSITLLKSFEYGDNSENSKRVTKTDRPYCIGLPKNKKSHGFGQIVTIAHRGKVFKALIVSNRKTSKTLPRYDKEYIVALNDRYEPAGTRITIPIPTQLRMEKERYSKIIAIASRFI